MIWLLYQEYWEKEKYAIVCPPDMDPNLYFLTKVNLTLANG
jgi:hypothetical protein